MTQISGVSYSIDIAVFTELINKGKEPGFTFDYEEFGLGSSQFEVCIENTRCNCEHLGSKSGHNLSKNYRFLSHILIHSR